MEKKVKRENKWIKKGDKVIIIAGNDRTKVGPVLSRTNDKIIVQGINLRKKHVKRTEQNQKGGIIEMEKPIHISNVRICVDEKKPLKLYVRSDEKGQRELYYKRDKKTATYRSLKKS